MENHSAAAMPKVSVVIPFYANVAWLCEAVESVLQQDYDNLEVIVINDGSQEDVSDFLKQYGDKIIYREKENGGCASARNAGFPYVTGEYIAFMDSDDLWPKNKLQRQMQKMLQYHAAWSYTDFELFGEHIETSVKHMFADRSEGLQNKVSPYIGTPTVIAKTDLITGHGITFIEGFRYGQDNVFWERLLCYAPVLYIPENLARVRVRGNNAARRAAVQIHARVVIYDNCCQYIDGYKEKCSRLYRFAMSLCRFGRKFVNESKLGSKGTELKARVLFAVPYVLFKLDRKLH